MGLSLHILGALIAGAGLFVAVISLRWTRAGQNLKRITALRQSSEETMEAEPPEEDFFRSVRQRGLDITLAQADLDVTPAGFIRTGILLGLIGLAFGLCLYGRCLCRVIRLLAAVAAGRETAAI